MLTFEQFRETNVARCREVWHHELWNPTDWLVCVLGELGEVAHIFKNLHGQEDIREMADRVEKLLLADEIGDTLIYLDLLAARCGLSLEECVRYKFNAVSQRVNSPKTL